MNKTELLQQYARDLRVRPRRSGLAVVYVGDLLERLGIWLQSAGAELSWRRLRAVRRWGQ